MFKNVALALLCVSSLSGCTSSLQTYLERSTRTEPVVRGPTHHNGDAPVAGISLNSNRRLVVSNRSDSSRFTCSEPPPDTGVNQATQTALSASANSTADDKKPNASFSDSAILTSIILSSRTEMVEMWRTTSYNYCLLLMNNAKTEADTYLIHGTVALIAASQASTEKVNAALAQETAKRDAAENSLNNIITAIKNLNTPPAKTP